MSFWTSSIFEPKQDFKWQVLISSGIGDLPHFYAKSIKKPAFSVQMKNYKLVNREIRQPANLIWEPIDIVFVDTADSKITKFIKKYLEEINYTNINEKTLTNTTTSKDASRAFLVGALNAVEIKQFNSNGNVIEHWKLHNPQISKFSASDLNYDNDSISTYTITIEYDWATLDEEQRPAPVQGSSLPNQNVSAPLLSTNTSQKNQLPRTPPFAGKKVQKLGKLKPPSLKPNIDRTASKTKTGRLKTIPAKSTVGGKKIQKLGKLKPPSLKPNIDRTASKTKTGRLKTIPTKSTVGGKNIKPKTSLLSKVLPKAPKATKKVIDKLKNVKLTPKKNPAKSIKNNVQPKLIPSKSSISKILKPKTGGPKITPKAGPKIVAKPSPTKGTPKITPKAGPKIVAKPSPTKGTPKITPKASPKAASKPAPAKSAPPKPAPKAASKPAPAKSAPPKPAPKAASKPAPAKSAPPKPAPKAASKPAPAKSAPPKAASKPKTKKKGK